MRLSCRFNAAVGCRIVEYSVKDTVSSGPADSSGAIQLYSISGCHRCEYSKEEFRRGPLPPGEPISRGLPQVAVETKPAAAAKPSSHLACAGPLPHIRGQSCVTANLACAGLQPSCMCRPSGTHMRPELHYRKVHLHPAPIRQPFTTNSISQIQQYHRHGCWGPPPPCSSAYPTYSTLSANVQERGALMEQH